MAAVLDTLITHVKSALKTGSTSVYEMLHEELSRLLDYFHPPTKVTSYLAPINALDLQQRQLISFMYTAHDLEQAHMVIGAMLSYKPHKAAQQPRGAAAFLVTADTSNTLPTAKVHVLLSPPEHLLSSVMQKWDRNPFVTSYKDPYGHIGYYSDNRNIMHTRAAIMCENRDPAEAETVVSLKKQGSKGHFVAANDKWLGQYLLRTIAAQPNSLKGGCCGVSSGYASGTTWNPCTTPVWVLMW